MDSILDAGDELYNSLNLTSHLLHFADIHVWLGTLDCIWQVTQGNENSGSIETRCIDLCLLQTFQQGSAAILLLGGAQGASASAIMK